MRSFSLVATMFSLIACARANPIPHGDAGPRLDGGPGGDAFVPGADAFVPPNDAFVPGVDAFVPPNDAFVTGTRAYLDRCSASSDCASGLCAVDRGGSRFCSRSCASDLQCAHEHVCVTGASGGVCLPDDTGAPCSVGTPETCNLGLCLGSAAGGRCTRDCSSAADCPAGYACSHVAGSSRHVCIDIEQPCSGAADCGGGFCTTFGCTAPCDSPADCPARLPATSTAPAFPAYACDTSLGSAVPICIPPADIVGSVPVGGSCAVTNACRSDACDTSAPLGAMCTQACTAQGGCGPGLGCTPLVDGADILLVCERAGSAGLTQTCNHGYECASGICDGSGAVGHCTRLCADGICPTGYTCQSIAGFGISLCRP